MYKCPQALISTPMPSHAHFLVLHFDLLCAAIHHILALLIEYLTAFRTYSYDNSSPSTDNTLQVHDLQTPLIMYLKQTLKPPKMTAQFCPVAWEQ